MTVTTRAPGDLVTAAIFNGKLEAPIVTAELNDLAVTSPKLAASAVTAAKIARQPVIQLKRTTDQAALGSGSDVLVAWESAAINSDNMWVIGTPGLVTIQTAGLYLCLLDLAFTANANGVRRAALYLSDTTPIALTQALNLGAGFGGRLFLRAQAWRSHRLLL